jgi:hypothetical protein
MAAKSLQGVDDTLGGVVEEEPMDVVPGGKRRHAARSHHVADRLGHCEGQWSIWVHARGVVQPGVRVGGCVDMVEEAELAERELEELGSSKRSSWIPGAPPR